MGQRLRGKSRPLRSLIGIAAVWALLAPPLTVAQESPELFLLNLEADGFLLAESVPAYASGDAYLIQCGSEPQQTANDWFTALLHKYRSEPRNDII